MVAECGGSPVRVRICPLFFFFFSPAVPSRTHVPCVVWVRIDGACARIHVISLGYHIRFGSSGPMRARSNAETETREASRSRCGQQRVRRRVEYRQVHDADWKPDHCCFRELGRSFSQFWVLLVYRSRNSGIAKERMSILDTSGSPDMLRVARRVSDEYRRRSLKKRGRKNRTRHHAKRMR